MDNNFVFDASLPVYIGCDHAGVSYKDALVTLLKEAGLQVEDKGTYSTDSVDYPDFAHPVAQAVDRKEAAFGILICGSGNGVNIVANKYPLVRSALCWQEELATLARQHNDANIIALPARFVTEDAALKMVSLFMKTPFEGGRHANRVNKISGSSCQA